MRGFLPIQVQPEHTKMVRKTGMPETLSRTTSQAAGRASFMIASIVRYLGDQYGTKIVPEFFCRQFRSSGNFSRRYGDNTFVGIEHLTDGELEEIRRCERRSEAEKSGRASVKRAGKKAKQAAHRAVR